MNYDYSKKEFELFIELYQTVSAYSAEHPMDTGEDECRKNIQAAMKQLGQTPYLKLAIADIDGFYGTTTLMGAMEAVAAVSPSLYLSAEYSVRVLGRAIARWGNETLKKTFLDPLLSGESLGALALCEETVNVDNDPLATIGERRDGGIVLNGRKQFVVNAPVASVVGVVGLLDDKPALFLVETGAPGMTIDDTPGDALGYKGVAISGLHLRNCVVQEDRVIQCGPKENMTAILRLYENQVLMGASIGLAKASFEAARDYAKNHRTGGKPIIAYQEIGFKLSEMLTLYQASQLLAIRAAWTFENKPKEAGDLSLCAKVFCAESASQVAGEAMKILGSSAYFGANPVERAYCCARYGEVFGTSTELSRVKIGDAALGVKA